MITRWRWWHHRLLAPPLLYLTHVEVVLLLLRDHLLVRPHSTEVCAAVLLVSVQVARASCEVIMLLDKGFHALHIYAFCSLLCLTYRQDCFTNPVIHVPRSELRYHVPLSLFYLRPIAGILLEREDEDPADYYGADNEADCLDKENNTC